MAIAADACRDPKREEAVGIVIEVLSPLLETADSLSVRLQRNLMTALTCLPQLQEFAGLLQPILHNIVTDIVRDPWKTEYLGLFKTACLDEDNLVDVLQYGLAARLIPEVRKYERAHGALHANEAHGKRICQVLEAIGLTLGGVPPTLLSELGGDILIPNLKYLIGERQSTSRLTQSQALICHILIRVATAAMISSQSAFDELCFGFHIFDLMIVPVKETMAEPLVLAAALNALAVITGNPVKGETFSAAFMEEFDSGVLLAYLRPLRMLKLADVYKEHAKTCMAAIGNFIAHLLELSRRLPMMYQLVDVMYDKGLAVLILDALSHKEANGDVRRALVGALVRFPIQRIDSGAIAIMLDLLSPANFREFEPQIFEYIVDALKHKLDIYSMERIVERTCWLLLVTLKTPEADRYKVLHVKCVELLQEASNRPTGKVLFREERHALSLRKALKYEEDFCAYDHPEVRVELTCVGGDVAFLSACMFDTFRLKHDCKQIFRVFRTVNRAISDVHGKPENELMTIEDICACEVGDFDDEPLEPKISQTDETRDDNSLAETPESSIANTEVPPNKGLATPTNVVGGNQVEQGRLLLQDEGLQIDSNVHRDQQRQLYVSMDMPKKIMSYLSASFSPTFTGYYQMERKRKEHSEYWAGLLKGRKLDCERLNIVDKFDWSVDCSNIFCGENLAEKSQLCEGISNAISKPTRQLVSYVNWKQWGSHQGMLHDGADPFYTVRPRKLLNKVWINECKKVINPCFVVSSFLRTLHALMAPGVSAVVRDAVRGHFRQADFVRNLIKLTTCSSFLDANIAAKMFRVCERAFTIDVSVQAESMDMIVIYDIVSRFAASFCAPLMDIVTNVSVDWVENSMQHVQLVLLRVFRIFALFARQMPWIKFSNVLEIQQYFVEKCVIRCVPEQALTLALRILFQIVSLETGSSVGTYVSHLYESDLLEQIREACVDIAVATSCAARNTHYFHVLNAISELRHSSSLLLRRSLVSDILRRIKLAELGKRFQERMSETRLERVLLMDDAWVVKKGGSTQNALVAVTSRNVHVIRAKREDDFKIQAKFRPSASIWEIENGLLYAAFAQELVADTTAKLTDSQWAMFALRHTPPKEFRHYVTAGNIPTLGRMAAKTLGDTTTYLGLCLYDNRICLAALTKDKLAIFAIDHVLLAEGIRNGTFTCGEDAADNGEMRPGQPTTVGLRPKSDTGSDESGSDEYSSDTESEDRPKEPIELLEECYCDSITSVAYGDDLAVAISVTDPDDEDEEYLWELMFVSDSRREAFKKALAGSIGHLTWYRRWESDAS
ncbi:leucine rich repeat-containing protein, putative [Babesia ovata]|uniref:Leucine rich repeat-containing protein, putative n=1 Tax=Babesia ovata TaxID=189622 RepID=A0A2H6KA68_9APIC|nr:leucine rich repeat-containing protein, putative [Babesia ovata]GBE59894.1 leucine rich repeat-containing protein, putative [Babesia ovata]